MEIFTIMLLVLIKFLLVLNQLSFLQLDRVNLMRLSNLEDGENSFEDYSKLFLFKKEIFKNSFLMEMLLFSMLLGLSYSLSFRIDVDFLYILVGLLLIEFVLYMTAKLVVYNNTELVFNKTKWITKLLSRAKPCKKLTSNRDLFSIEDISVILSRNGISLNISEGEFEEILATTQRNHKNVKSLLKVHRTSIVGIKKETTLKEAYSMLDKYDYNYYPVYEQSLDSILCIISREDILRLCLNEDQETCISDYIAKTPLPTVLEMQTVELFLKTIKEKGHYFWIVLDEYGGTEGIITLTDILEGK